MPICQSERVFTRFGFRPWIEKAATDIVMTDLSWGGGLTEGRKVAAMADTAYLPFTCHDTIGPVALWAATHMMLHVPNGADHGDGARLRRRLVRRRASTDRIPVADGMLDAAGQARPRHPPARRFLRAARTPGSKPPPKRI